MQRWNVSWVGRCSACGSWRSELEPEIASDELQQLIDTGARANGLREIRDRNNAEILERIGRLVPLKGARLLDVGSAHGWFLEAAAAREVHAEGVEPELRLAEITRSEGKTVRDGYFPDVIADDERFEAITFNDVLEHVPDASGAVAACADLLADGGVLSVNIPSATGLGYRVATLLARVGVLGPFKRFWQYGLPSPHMHYMQPEALRRLVERHGLVVRSVTPLASIQRSGLWARLHTIRRPSPISALAFAALWLAAPILNRPRQSDVVLLLAQRPARTSS
ncbi:class I SAM-dependent methyltransferase [Patulibacter americanus]|uniref:class I SAM-dependent methyltransferase n=1 Tax=Patulibacter americanus TaxID=588672 RepID=UPI0003B329F3|nr:class I SAM-dependent methyltransferase [Patulibacter americanus]